MSVVVAELYVALRAAGVEEDVARAAATAVLVEARTELATKADVALLKADLVELEGRLIKWNVGAIFTMTAIFAAIVKLL